MFNSIVVFFCIIIVSTQIIRFNHQFDYGIVYSVIELFVLIMMTKYIEIKEFVSVYRKRNKYAREVTDKQLLEAQGDDKKYRVMFASDYYKLNKLIANRNIPYPISNEHHWEYYMPRVTSQATAIDKKIAKISKLEKNAF